MGKFETDKKLELIHAIRMQNHYDRQLLKRRESILYDQPLKERYGEIYSLEEAALPTLGKYNGKFPVSTDKEEPKSNTIFHGLRLRLALAMICFLGFVYCDVKQVSIGDRSMKEIFIMMQEDELGRFMETLVSFGKSEVIEKQK